MSDLLPPGIPPLTYEDLKDELVGFLHGEKTAYSRDVIQYYIDNNRRLNKAYNELQGLTKLLQHTPEIEPSKNFHRRIAKALPQLRHTHKVSTNLQTLITEAGWGLEERVLFLWAYLKFRVKQQPSAILSLCGMILFLLTAITILPKVLNTNSLSHGYLSVHDVVIPDVIKADKGIYNNTAKPKPILEIDTTVEIPDIDYKFAHTFRKMDYNNNDYPEKAKEKRIIKNVIQNIPSNTSKFLLQPKLQVLNWFSKRKTKNVNISDREREAIDDALTWLAKNQHKNGSFQVKSPGEANNHSEITEGKTENEIATDNTTIILTAYAALAFITDGYSSFAPVPTKQDGMSDEEYSVFRKKFLNFRLVTRNAVNFLKSVQSDDGFLAKYGENAMLAHSLSLLAMIEDRITSNNWRLIATIREGVNYLAQYQNYDGGWGHKPADNLSLLHTTVWSTIALKTADQSDADLLAEYPKVFSKVADFLKVVTDEEGYYLESDRKAYPDGYMRPTSEGLLLSTLLNQQISNTTLDKTISLLTTENAIPKWEFTRKASNGTYVDYDYWFFGFLALNSKLDKLNKKQVKQVETWSENLTKVLLDNQYEYGAWEEVNPHASWGKIYSTTLAVLTLQNKYRYAFN